MSKMFGLAAMARIGINAIVSMSPMQNAVSTGNFERLTSDTSHQLAAPLNMGAVANNWDR